MQGPVFLAGVILIIIFAYLNEDIKAQRENPKKNLSYYLDWILAVLSLIVGLILTIPIIMDYLGIIKL